MNDPIDFLRFPSGTTVRRIKKDARKLSKSSSLSHSEALDCLAREHGINAPWSVALSRLRLNRDTGGLVRPVPISKSDNDVFHRVQIGHLVFSGFVSGPDIHVSSRPAEAIGDRYRWTNEVALGPAVIFPREEGLNGVETGDFGDGHYWVCKYDPFQGRIPLKGLSEEEVIALASEFGIRVKWMDERPSRRGDFFASPAWASLQTWIAEHPRKAKGGLRANYVDWYRAAVGIPS